jgi:hypothetical protein
MNSMNAIDTNVFAYAFDPADPAKQAQARKLLHDLFATSVPPRVALKATGVSVTALIP